MTKMSIVGVAAMDEFGCISSSNLPISFLCNNHIMKLDQSIFRNVLAVELWNDSVVVCMGASTFEELQGTKAFKMIEHTGAYLVVSSDRGVEVIHRIPEWAPRVSNESRTVPMESIEFDPTTTKTEKKQIAAATAMRIALNVCPSDPKILVLGGKSVYEMFESQYTKFHKVLVLTPESPTEPKGILPPNQMIKAPYESTEQIAIQVGDSSLYYSILEHEGK